MEKLNSVHEMLRMSSMWTFDRIFSLFLNKMYIPEYTDTNPKHVGK
jgi:hypothetical protein